MTSRTLVLPVDRDRTQLEAQPGRLRAENFETVETTDEWDECVV